MRIDIVTIFPEYLAPLRESLIGRAIDQHLISLAVHNLRDWTKDRHHTVDDTPYGGGPGMVMRPDVWGRALDDILGAVPATTPGACADDDSPDSGPVLIIPTPSGGQFTQRVAAELATRRHLVFACGRYEGIDGRVALDARRRLRVEELSIGDYVLAGGEAPVLVMVEAIGRLLPGVLGNADSAGDDSFSDATGALLEGPVYTRPPEYRGLPVPPDLMTGNHAAIARYRRDESLRRTAAHRPELLARLTAQDCDAADLDLLMDLGTPLPAGLAERVAAERAARSAKKRRRHR